MWSSPNRSQTHPITQHWQISPVVSNNRTWWPRVRAAFKSQMNQIGFSKERSGLERALLVTSGSIRGERQSGLQKAINHGTFPATQASTAASHTGGNEGQEADWLAGTTGKRRGSVRPCDLIKTLCISRTVTTAQPHRGVGCIRAGTQVVVWPGGSDSASARSWEKNPFMHANHNRAGWGAGPHCRKQHLFRLLMNRNLKIEGVCVVLLTRTKTYLSAISCNGENMLIGR